MAQPYVGEIRMFGGNFAPAGWMFCNGQILPISENETRIREINLQYMLGVNKSFLEHFGVNAFVGGNLMRRTWENISANGSRALFTRDVAAITMDLNGVERIQFNALGGTDNIVVNDLTGTDVVAINVNQAGTIGGAAGDAAADTLILNGTNGNDIIDVFGGNK